MWDLRVACSHVPFSVATGWGGVLFRAGQGHRTSGSTGGAATGHRAFRFERDQDRFELGGAFEYGFAGFETRTLASG